MRHITLLLWRINSYFLHNYVLIFYFSFEGRDIYFYLFSFFDSLFLISVLNTHNIFRWPEIFQYPNFSHSKIFFFLLAIILEYLSLPIFPFLCCATLDGYRGGKARNRFSFFFFLYRKQIFSSLSFLAFLTLFCEFQGNTFLSP